MHCCVPRYVVSPAGRKNSYTSQSQCWLGASDSLSHYISSNCMSEGCYRWGNWGTETLSHMTNVAQLQSIRAGTPTPAWPRTSTFSLITPSTAFEWKRSSPARERVCTCMWLGACQGKGSCHLAGVALFYKCIISWQVLCTFIMVHTLHAQSTKGAGNSGLFYNLKFEDIGRYLFVYCLPTMCQTLEPQR